MYVTRSDGAEVEIAGVGFQISRWCLPYAALESGVSERLNAPRTHLEEEEEEEEEKAM